MLCHFISLLKNLMSSSLNGTSTPCKSKVEGEVHVFKSHQGACVNIYLKKGFTPFFNDSQGRKLWMFNVFCNPFFHCINMNLSI